MKRERIKLVKKKQANLHAVRVKVDQLRLVLANKYAALEQEDKDSIEVMNETLTRLISEAAIEVGGKLPRQPVGKLSQKTKDLIKKRQNMKVSNSRIQIEFAELSKLINKQKPRDIRNYNLEKIEEAVKYGRSMKSVRRKLGIGQGKLKDKQGKISNFNDIVKAAEEFYNVSRAVKLHSFEVVMNRMQSAHITSNEVRRTLKDITTGKAAGEDGITVELIKDGADILEKLAALYTQCLAS